MKKSIGKEFIILGGALWFSFFGTALEGKGIYSVNKNLSRIANKMQRKPIKRRRGKDISAKAYNPRDPQSPFRLSRKNRGSGSRRNRSISEPVSPLLGLLGLPELAERDNISAPPTPLLGVSRDRREDLPFLLDEGALPEPVLFPEVGAAVEPVANVSEPVVLSPDISPVPPPAARRMARRAPNLSEPVVLSPDISPVPPPAARRMARPVANISTMKMPEMSDAETLPQSPADPTQYAKNEELKSKELAMQPVVAMTKDEATQKLGSLLRQAVGSEGKIGVEKVRKLLEAGGNPNTQDKNGMALLHQAVMAKNLDMVALLLEYNADPNLADNDGGLPLDLAEKINEKQIINILRQKGAKTKKELEKEKEKSKKSRSSKRAASNSQNDMELGGASQSGPTELGKSSQEKTRSDSSEWQNNVPVNNPVPSSEQDSEMTYDWNRKKLKIKMQTRFFTPKQVNENPLKDSGKAILHVNQIDQIAVSNNINLKDFISFFIMSKVKGIAMFLLILKEISQFEYVAGDKKILLVSRTSVGKKHYLGKADSMATIESI
ncbi:MAG: ankyrin repeat domain-containing protein [Puniceicoccales bacterium]|jgi:hypothetical protein|nr:ankyrin repeat domain-containing protein [Puniceicoccales bacterium]